MTNSDYLKAAQEYKGELLALVLANGFTDPDNIGEEDKEKGVTKVLFIEDIAMVYNSSICIGIKVKEGGETEYVVDGFLQWRGSHLVLFAEEADGSLSSMYFGDWYVEKASKGIKLKEKEQVPTKKYRVYQTLSLGVVEVPESVTDISEWLDKNDAWPDDEVVEDVEFVEVTDDEFNKDAYAPVKAVLFDRLHAAVAKLYKQGITGQEDENELGFKFYHDEEINKVMTEYRSYVQE